LQIIGIQGWRNNVREEQNGRESLRRLKTFGDFNGSKRRRRIMLYNAACNI